MHNTFSQTNATGKKKPPIRNPTKLNHVETKLFTKPLHIYKKNVSLQREMNQPFHYNALYNN